jgi:preprotein translocase subunit SecE
MAKAAAAVGNGEDRVSRVTSLPERIKLFYNDVRTEMRKVTSPSRKEVQATTAVVIITVFLFAAYFYGVDRVLGFAIDSLLKWAKTA